ncbi:MAG TPA: sodium:solute symporter family protein [Gemmatimonadaceae bacterium]|nr:sodium:solute symporter family protein [Gemmatimonadaceae bacterium]
MNFSAADWAVVVAYFALTLGIGFYFTKRGGENMEEYFISGRKVPWWLAGVAMVATTFAADTPLAVTGMVASRGVAGNWLWWNMVMSGILTVFFFARLWRRAGVMTDVQLAELRYGGNRAAVLRGFRALYLAIPINLIIMGWVTMAMVKILTISLGVSPWIGAIICFVFTTAYASAAGMWAVLWTDFFQFILMMTAVIILAIYAVDAAGGMEAVKAHAITHFGSESAALSVLPVSFTGSGIQAYTWMPLMTLLTFIAVQWWAAWYPGAEPGGGGYVAQRIFSAKTERDGVLATLFFQVAHYAIRPWPWIVTALATLVLYPDLQNREDGYVKAFVDHLPTPWRGVMLAGFAAAYMSTMATHLNWGASYIVNDVYKRFLKKGETEKHYVNVARLSTIVLFLMALVVTRYLTTVEGAWRFLIAIGAGTGLVLILRWYWWRINAWSEISAMVASFVVSLVAMQVIPQRFAAGDPRADSWVLLVTVAVSTVAWVAVTFLTKPEPDAVLERFYRQVRPGGGGWAAVSTRLGFGREPIPGGAMQWTNWLAGVIAVYTTLFGLGQFILGTATNGFILLAIAAVCFVWIARSLRVENEPLPVTAQHRS